MRFLTTRGHGPLDYLVGFLLILLPGLVGFCSARPEGAVPVALGTAAVLYSLVTAYEWGLVSLIPMRVHLALDFGSGVLLAASPWLFGFADRVWVPHVVIGLFEVAAAVVTQTVPGRTPAVAPSPEGSAG